MLGFFERRFAPDGRVLAQVQGPYSEAMRAKKKKASFKGYSYRSTRFHLDPFTGQSQFSFAPLRLYGSSEDFDLFMDTRPQAPALRLPARQGQGRAHLHVRDVHAALQAGHHLRQ